MSLKYFDYDLTANLSLDVRFNLDLIGIQNADLINGIDIPYGTTNYSLTLSGTLTDGTNQTYLASSQRRYNWGDYYYYLYESRLKNRNGDGEADITINKFYPPSEFVDSITASPSSSLTASMDEYTIGTIDSFSRFYGWKKITYNYYDINNNLSTLYGWLAISGNRTGVDIIGSGTVSYWNTNDRILRFTLTAAANIETYGNAIKRASTYPPFNT